MVFHSPGGVGNHRINVFCFEIRVCFKKSHSLFFGCQQPTDGTDGNPKAANAWLPAHDSGIVRNSSDIYCPSLLRFSVEPGSLRYAQSGDPIANFMGNSRAFRLVIVFPKSISPW